jgi:hypothetical protein
LSVHNYLAAHQNFHYMFLVSTMTIFINWLIKEFKGCASWFMSINSTTREAGQKDCGSKTNKKFAGPHLLRWSALVVPFIWEAICRKLMVWNWLQPNTGDPPWSRTKAEKGWGCVSSGRVPFLWMRSSEFKP